MKTDASTEWNGRYTDEQIYKMRAYLARRWNQTIAQVTDYEARAYLDAEYAKDHDDAQ